MGAFVNILIDAARALLQGHELWLLPILTFMVLGLTLSGVAGRVVSWAETYISRP